MHNPLPAGSKGRFIRVFLAGICLVNLESRAAELALSGFYQGKNLFVQNPFAADRQSFCTEEVYLNDQKVMSGIKSSAYEIDLSALKVNDAVKVRIVHREGCAPKVLNPQVLRSTAVAFQFISFTVGKDAIRWNTSGEQPNSMYFVEQFISKNWLAIKTIYSKNTTNSGTYSVAPAHSAGLNRYRVKAQDQEGKVFYSREVDFSSVQETVTFYPKSVTDKITLSRAVPYEVLDVKQKTVKRGKGKEIALKELKTGVYYLTIDNRTEKFFKK
ncbi:MAG: hypothetical protein H7Z75_17325 [Ferruginibacter sp.]|nr:hypothetical protein [Cytophagales bacterium]